MSVPECPTCGRGDFESAKGMKTHHKLSHGESISGVAVTCEQCGSEYREKPNRIERSRFCSQECQNQWLSENQRGENHPNRTGEVVECGNCGDSYYRPECEATEREFCSQECRKEWFSENMDELQPASKQSVTVECESCGCGFDVVPSRENRARFCSKDCLGDFNGKNLSGENAPWWSGGHVDYGPGWNKPKRKAVRERDEHKCQDCGMAQEDHLDKHGEKLHVHHIQKARTFDDPEKRNDKNNLITLCRGCHSRWEELSPLAPDNRTTE